MGIGQACSSLSDVKYDLAAIRAYVDERITAECANGDYPRIIRELKAVSYTPTTTSIINFP